MWWQSLLFLSCLFVFVSGYVGTCAERASTSICDQQSSVEHKDGLLILLPFIEKQTDLLVDVMERLWVQVPPFDDPTAVNDHITLALYYHRSVDDHPENNRSRLLAALAASPFAPRARLVYANLTADEDLYPAGANRMFYKFFGLRARQDVLKRIDTREEDWRAAANGQSLRVQLSRQHRCSVMFLMEPDVRPIRAGWADKAWREAMVGPDPSLDRWWIKGSQWHGDFLPDHLRVHINGNALYRIGDQGDPDDQASFLALLEQAMNSMSIAMGYDNVICQTVLKSGWFYSHFHKLRWSDFIRNYSWRDFSLAKVLDEAPNTFFIHGGRNSDDPSETKRAYTELPENWNQ